MDEGEHEAGVEGSVAIREGTDSFATGVEMWFESLPGPGALIRTGLFC